MAIRLIAAALAVSLSATKLMAADVISPLPIGKTAGIKKAQDSQDTMMRLAAGAVFIGIIIISMLPQTATSTTATTS